MIPYFRLSGKLLSAEQDDSGRFNNPDAIGNALVGVDALCEDALTENDGDGVSASTLAAEAASAL